MLKKKTNAKTEARIQEILRRGHELERRKRVPEAIAEYRKALELDRNYIGTCQLLGMLYHSTGENHLAEPLLARVVKAFPNRADLQCAYGAALSAIGEHKKSSEQYLKALAIDPQYLIAQYNYGQEMVYLGNIPTAIEAFQRTLAIDPLFAGAYHQLAILGKFREYDDDIRIMEQLHGQLEGEDRKLLSFGLFAAHKKIGNYDQAFDYLLEGNRLHRATLDYSTARTEQSFREIKQAFDADVLNSEIRRIDGKPTPIFIVGMPRSGTSLAEQILASHSAVHGCGELSNLSRLYRGAFPAGCDLSSKVRGLSASDREVLGRQYLDEVAAMAGGKPYITDKMPQNFLHVGLIALLFPDARIIHCTRHPLDNCLSIFSYLFSGSHSYGYDLQELGEYYSLYQGLMAHWERLLPGRIHTLNYERVVEDTENEVRQLLEYCELPFEEGCLSFFENERAVVTVSATQVRQPIYQSSVQAWKVFEKGLGPLSRTLDL